MGEGQPVLRSGDPEGVMQEMWALFAVYQAICRIVGLAVDAAGIPRTGSASRTPWPPRRTRSRLFPPTDRADLALATFLTKILMPGFFTRDRPDRASPRKTKKPATSPPASPASPASPGSPAESSSTCSAHGRSPKSNAIGPPAPVMGGPPASRTLPNLSGITTWGTPRGRPCARRWAACGVLVAAFAVAGGWTCGAAAAGGSAVCMAAGLPSRLGFPGLPVIKIGRTSYKQDRRGEQGNGNVCEERKMCESTAPGREAIISAKVAAMTPDGPAQQDDSAAIFMHGHKCRKRASRCPRSYRQARRRLVFVASLAAAVGLVRRGWPSARANVPCGGCWRARGVDGRAASFVLAASSRCRGGTAGPPGEDLSFAAKLMTNDLL